MSETVEGIVTAVDEREIDTKYGKKTKYTLKLDVNGDSLSFQTWNEDQAKMARDLLDDPGMVRIAWEQEDNWTDKDGNERPGGRKVNTITGPLREAKQSGNGDVPDSVWRDKDLRIVRQNSWRHATALSPYVATALEDPSVQDIFNGLRLLAEKIERHIVRNTDLEIRDAEDVPF